MNFLDVCDVSLAENRSGLELIRITIRIQEFLSGILPLRDRGNYTNFQGLASCLAEVCGLRVRISPLQRVHSLPQRRNRV